MYNVKYNQYTLPIIGIIISDIALLLQQFHNYTFATVSASIKFIFVVFVLICGLLVFFTKRQIKVSRIFLNTLFIVFDIIIIMFFTGASDLSQYYNASIDFVLFLSWILLLHNMSANDFEIIRKIQIIVFFVAFIGYLYARLTESFYQPGQHSSINYFFMLLPFIYTCKKKYIIYIAVICSLFAAFMEMNRTTFFIGSILFTYYLFKSRVKNIIKPIIILWLSMIGIWYLYSILVSQFGVDIFARTIYSNDVSSGRFSIYSDIINVWQNSDFINIFFGNGFMATTSANDYGIAAHNDFIEFLFDFGILGLSIFVLFIIVLIKTLKKARDYQTYHISCDVSLIIVVLMCASNSLFFNFGPAGYLLLFWAYMLSGRKSKIS